MNFKRDRAIRIRVASVILKKDKILLIAHKKNDNIYWLLPGGGVKFGESLEEALKRELIEELSVKIDVNNIAIVCDSVDPYSSRHVLNICFNCTFIEGKYTLGNEKRLHNFGFFSHDELHNLKIFPPIREELQNILNGIENKEIYLGARWINL